MTMKNRITGCLKFICAMALLALLISFAFPDSNPKQNELVERQVEPVEEESYDPINSSGFKSIKQASITSNVLVYDEDTKVVYYYAYQIDGSFDYSLCPYISENGKFCRYINGKIVEIIQ